MEGIVPSSKTLLAWNNEISLCFPTLFDFRQYVYKSVSKKLLKSFWVSFKHA